MYKGKENILRNETIIEDLWSESKNQKRRFLKVDFSNP
jgi:hypothetical protein